MASVNFEKLKTPQQVKAMLRHCDGEERMEANHSNIDIDKSKTSGNMQGDLDYTAACQKYSERIAFLDAKPGANKRKDRVTCFGLNVPAPKDLKPEDEKAFFLAAIKIIINQYGENNIIQYYMHQDEKHAYIHVGTGERCMSRSHLQCYVVPEHNGKLNGKWFSSRANMVKLNNSIHRMAQEQFGVMFMDGSKRKSRKTVEQLKNESAYLAIQQELDAQKIALDTQTAEVKKEKQIILQTKVMLYEQKSDLDQRENGIKANEDDSRAALQDAATLRDTALQLLLRVQQVEEENMQLIELGKQERRRQRVSALDSDEVIKAYHELNGRLNDLVPQK